jgi:hypothetical protein
MTKDKKIKELEEKVERLEKVIDNLLASGKDKEYIPYPVYPSVPASPFSPSPSYPWDQVWYTTGPTTTFTVDALNDNITVS